MAITKILGKPGIPARRSPITNGRIPEEIRSCRYCQKGLMPFKRIDALYCSDSCRVMACVKRKRERQEVAEGINSGGWSK